MTGHKIRIKGYATKDGKIVPKPKYDASKQRRIIKSKRVKVVKRV